MWVPGSKVVFIVCVATTVSGCAQLNTRPGHPDSYASTSYYKSAPLWSVAGGAATGPSVCQAGSGADAQIADLRCKQNTPAPPHFVTTDVPHEIWQARGYAHNMAVRYTAASYKAQDVQDFMVVPLLGAAVATAAVAIAKASTVAVAATGIGASAAGAAYSYAHPDTDAATDQSAAAGLACVVDESEPLHAQTSVTLILDRAAIEDGLAALKASTANLLAKAKPNSAEDAQASAVTAAQKAATDEITALMADIKAYDKLPSLIYKAADDIDDAAKKGGSRVFKVADLVQQLKSSGAAQVDKTMAQMSLAGAKGAATVAKPLANPARVQSITSTPSPSLDGVTTPLGEPDKRSAVSSPGSADPTEAVLATSKTAAKYTSLKQVLGAAADEDPRKLIRLVETAQDDDPDPTFAVIGSNISECALQATKATP